MRLWRSPRYPTVDLLSPGWIRIFLRPPSRGPIPARAPSNPRPLNRRTPTPDQNVDQGRRPQQRVPRGRPPSLQASVQLQRHLPARQGPTRGTRSAPTSAAASAASACARSRRRRARTIRTGSAGVAPAGPAAADQPLEELSSSAAEPGRRACLPFSSTRRQSPRPVAAVVCVREPGSRGMSRHRWASSTRTAT